jgi:DNA-directed RNA polymerase specialized sigma24 family protein
MESAGQALLFVIGREVGALLPVGQTLPHESPPDEVLALASALEELARIHPRKHKVVLLRFFAGRTNEKAAGATGLSPVTVAREWRFARAWLHARLGEPGAAGSSSRGLTSWTANRKNAPRISSTKP